MHTISLRSLGESKAHRMNNLNWQNIRPWKGSQPGGFEELCVQLARVDTPEEAEFVSTGAPDAGVECYCIFPDASEWGWQAKYFTSPLTDAQWHQLDASVKTALAKHPRLACYCVCVPRDRSDARISGRKSEMDRWKAHVSKWEGWAQGMGMDVKFVWRGSSELIERLSREEHAGRRFFWFSQREFGQDWFQRRLNEAVAAAGPRYTPEVHVDLPVSQDLERFGRSALLFAEVKSLAIGIRRARDSLAAARRLLEVPVESDDLDDLSKATSAVLDSLSQLEPSPSNSLPFAGIAKAAENAYNIGCRASEQIWILQHQHEAQSKAGQHSQTYYQEPFRSLPGYVERLLSGLQKVSEVCDRADSLANSQLLLLKGDGGIGKTHLLCDFAKRRIDAQMPTILLMGQGFHRNDDPWTQLLRLLDLREISAEEFVGALEAAAQLSGCRALVIIDALNEGNGRKIWGTHLSAFLERVKKSSWIGVILSVRSSYEEDVIPENVREQAVHITHPGFTDHEYDAVKAFFTNYNLEFPSAPILQPEFRNPLFLKTICKGLHDSGEHRMPKGFHGITAAFDLHLKAINARLAKREALDYDPKNNLVHKALEKISECLAKSETRRLLRSEAQTVVYNLLPGPSYSKSLYAALVTEGILTEDRGWQTEYPSEEVTFITYDRFADHIIANYLLSAHLNADDPDAAFSNDGGLAFLCEENRHVPPGLIEALCIQIPERTGRELVRLAPKLFDLWHIGDTFLESLVWRKLDAFSDDTLAVLGELIEGEKVHSDPLDALLTVSTIPGHPLNADLLDQRLRQDIMPDRDARWSTYLHRTWKTQSPVDRVVDWASGISPKVNLEAEVVDLAATTLAWMLTTSNRFLRDRATKALVALLTGRLDAVTRLVDRFSDIDDPYVTERVYAVTYGVAMRSYDVKAVGELAFWVYSKVFASGSPPAHILLRDYARGVVERAIHLGSGISVNQRLIRPPYTSEWPDIPSEDVIEELTPNLDRGAWADGDFEWSRNRIRYSVMGDIFGDFARYVIGTDFASNWLSLHLDEGLWQSPEERTKAFISRLSETERLAWDNFRIAESKAAPIAFLLAIQNIQDAEQAQVEAELAYEQLMAALTEEHQSEWDTIRHDKEDFNVRQGPRFDKKLIQRYILWRVFDLGWTVERFGYFDKCDIRYSGRAAAKAERMGKKYQWIAYHEILACIADRYQYRERYAGESAQCRYEGPWQESLRDIDPSCTLRSTPGGTSWEPHKPAWWEGERYDAWDEDSGHQDWLADRHRLPKIEKLLQVVNPNDGTSWVNVDGSFLWQQPHLADQELYDYDLRELWILFTGYFVRSVDAESFIAWTQTADFQNRWMPKPPESSSVHIGEYGWSPAFKHLYADCQGFEGWVKPTPPNGMECPVAIRPASFRYLADSGDFDCSIEEYISLRLPHHEFIEHLGIRASSNGVDYLDASGYLAAFDPTAHETGPTALLLSKPLLEKYLQERGLALCWVVLGEKQVVGGDARKKYPGRLNMSGVYRYTDQGPQGFLTFSLDSPRGVDS